MKKEQKSVNYYNHTLLKGSVKGFKWNEELCMTAEGESATYITEMFDTKDEAGSYNRLIIEGDFPQMKLEVIAAATDTLSPIWLKDFDSLNDYFKSDKVPVREKGETLKKLSFVRGINATDMLLHDIKGRYIWVYIAVHPISSDASCKLNGFKFEYPKNSFTEYFPEIYQENNFFDKYIGIFQSIFLDEENKVASLPTLLDYETAPDHVVEQLALWVGIDNNDKIFSPAQLRTIIANMDLYQGAKGTTAALSSIIELACGKTPKIVENFKWNSENMPSSRREMYGNLYGASYNDFCVIIDISDGYQMPINDEKLEIIIDNYSMVGTGHKLVKLDMCPHSDTHCYLDVNGILSTPMVAETSGIALGSHITMG